MQPVEKISQINVYTQKYTHKKYGYQRQRSRHQDPPASCQIEFCCTRLSVSRAISAPFSLPCFPGTSAVRPWFRCLPRFFFEGLGKRDVRAKLLCQERAFRQTYWEGSVLKRKLALRLLSAFLLRLFCLTERIFLRRSSVVRRSSLSQPPDSNSKLGLFLSASSVCTATKLMKHPSQAREQGKITGDAVLAPTLVPQRNVPLRLSFLFTLLCGV
mmetsp:Transcript_29342/g.57593  ORF Transcript_29342/g.57593 Transcript_29342/m.57593 type:complete len:214 (+) Transcript_29342:1606-2247(+)